MNKEKTKTEIWFEKNVNNSNTTTTDSYSTNNESYESFFDKLEATRKKRDEEQRLAAEKQAALDYYNTNKETMIETRTKSLIYDSDLDKAGGRLYDYNGAVDISTADLKTKLGLSELKLDNFLVKKQDATNKAKLEEFNKKQELLSNQYGNNTFVNDKSKTNSNFISPMTPTLNNPYADDIKAFNKAINEGKIRTAQNAIQRINSRYFGADFEDGIWAGMGDMIFGDATKDQTTLKVKFDDNVTKLKTINDTIAKTTDKKVLIKLNDQKNQLEFENQLIQYNRLTYLEAETLTMNELDNLEKSMHQPFEGAANIKIDDTNLFTKSLSTLNKGIQYIGAAANFITESTFGALNLIVTDDQNEGFVREASGVIADTATYLIPYVGQARLALTTAKSGSIIVPGVMNNLGGEYESSVLGKNPTAMNTIGATLDIAAVYASNKIFSKIKGNLGLEGQRKFYQYSGKEIAKLITLDSTSEIGEEFFQTYAEHMMYNENFGVNDFLDKKYFVQAIQNGITAGLLTVGLSSVGHYKNNVTSDNILIRTDDTKSITGLLKQDGGSKNSQIDTPTNLQKNIYDTLSDNKIVTIIDPNALDYDNVGIQNISNIVSSDSMMNSNNSILTNLENAGINIQTTSAKDAKIISDLNTNIQTILNKTNSPDEYNKVIAFINDLSNTHNIKQATSIYDSLNLDSPGLTSGKVKSLFDGITTLNKSLSTKIADVSISNLSAYENVRTVVVPSIEMETYIKGINPNVNTIVINPKDPNFGANLQSYLDGQSKFGIKPRNTAKNEIAKQHFNANTAQDVSNLVNDIQTDLKLKDTITDTFKDIVIDFEVNNSSLNDSSIESVKSSIKSQMIDALPKDLNAKKAQQQFKKFSDNLEGLMPTDRKSQVYLSDVNGANIVFAKTGSNIYETSNKVDSEGNLLTNVRSNGKILNGNLTTDAAFDKKNINAINKLITKLKLEGELLNDKSTAKDVLKLINKNPDFSKEILQALGYDGIISGKKKLKYISAHDDSDNINMDMASDVLTIKAKDIVDNHKDTKNYVPKTKEIKPETIKESIANDNKTISKDSFISDSKDSEYFSPDIIQEFRDINITDKKAKRKINNVFDYFYTALVDKYHPIVKDAKAVGDIDVQNAISNLYTLENRHYNNANISQTNYNNEPIGKSIKQIFSTIEGKEGKALFDKTMRLLLNAERLDNGMEPIFPNISAEKSRYAAEKVIAKHPEFKTAIEDLRTYNNNSLDMLVDAGLITPELAKSLKEKYKYYVPIYTANPVDYIEIGSDSWFKSIQANDTIQDVTKAGKNFISIEESMRRKDYQQMKAILINDVMKTIANSKAGIDNYENMPEILYSGERTTEIKGQSSPIYGSGKYYTTDKKRASNYGDVKEYKKVIFQNPYIQGTKYNDTMIEILNNYAATHPDKKSAVESVINGGFPITKNVMPSSQIRDAYLKAGYDSFIGGQNKNEYVFFGKKDNSKNIYAGKSGAFTYFENGELKKFNTHNSYAEALGTQRVELIDKFFNLPIINTLPKIQKIKQKLITTYDPIFQLNNIMRDFQDTALFNTKYPTKFIPNYGRAIYNMSAKTELFHEFQKTGIITYDGDNKLANITSKMEALPKFAEYISSKDSGKTATEAKIESQGANLNFARRGWLGGQLNDKGFLFLNAAIQGADKAVSTGVGLVRGANTPAGFGRLVLTLGAAAAPGVINALLNEDDEDYAKLPYYYKNNYYFIKQKDGTFIRIPKGRVTAFVDTITRYATGISKESSTGNYFESLQSAADGAILPPELSDAAPWSLLTQISENRNFFGGEIYGPQDPTDVKVGKIAEHVMTDFFGRYGKTVKALTDSDSTTDLISQSSFLFNSTKYNKDIGTIYELNNYYNGLNKDTMDFETRIQKKYINTKISALNSIRGEINDMKKTDTIISEMRPTYQLSDALVKDILANYKNYHVEDNFDGSKSIYFDDETFIYKQNSKGEYEFRKVK